MEGWGGDRGAMQTDRQTDRKEERAAGAEMGCAGQGRVEGGLE